MLPKDIIDAKQDAVRLTSSKYKTLRAFVKNLRIMEVFDIRIDEYNRFVNDWSEFDFVKSGKRLYPKPLLPTVRTLARQNG